MLQNDIKMGPKRGKPEIRKNQQKSAKTHEVLHAEPRFPR